jgi:hypothetical protein
VQALERRHRHRRQDDEAMALLETGEAVWEAQDVAGVGIELAEPGPDPDPRIRLLDGIWLAHFR